MPGILEEVLIAVEKRKPVYLLGGFGGITERICRYILTGKLPEELTQKWQINNCDEYSKLIKKYTDHSIFIDYSRIESVVWSRSIMGFPKKKTNAYLRHLFLRR